jgi:hypothetical protein
MKPGGNLSKSINKGTITRKNSFGQWFSSINLQLFEDNVKLMNLDAYTKNLRQIHS